MREPCISVGYTATPGDAGHIKPSAMYVFTWLPKGYGPSMDDRTICTLFETDRSLESPLGRGERHPLVEAIAKTIEDYFKANPDQVIGFLDHPRSP